MGDEDVDRTVSMLEEAISLLDERLDQRMYTALFETQVRAGRWDGLLKAQEGLMERWIKKANMPEAHRVATAMVVVELSREDQVKAERLYRSLLADVPGYVESETGGACSELLEVMANNDVEGLLALQKGSRFNYLETCVVRLFKGLTLLAQQDGDEVDMT